jgi:Lon-like ATP-dependent protease
LSCLRYVFLAYMIGSASANEFQNIKEGIEGRPVQWYKEVFDIVFPGLDKDAANKMWEKELKGKKGDRKKREQKKKEEEEEESGEDDD